MANTFTVVTFAAEPASAGTAYKMYTCATSTTTVVLGCLLYTSPSPRDGLLSRMPSSA